MNKNNYAIIMAGGIGSRFWPMSRSTHPKQFLDILGTGETLIQQTYRRLSKVSPSFNSYIPGLLIAPEIAMVLNLLGMKITSSI